MLMMLMRAMMMLHAMRAKSDKERRLFTLMMPRL